MNTRDWPASVLNEKEFATGCFFLDHVYLSKSSLSKFLRKKLTPFLDYPSLILERNVNCF